MRGSSKHRRCIRVPPHNKGERTAANSPPPCGEGLGGGETRQALCWNDRDSFRGPGRLPLRATREFSPTVRLVLPPTPPREGEGRRAEVSLPAEPADCQRTASRGVRQATAQIRSIDGSGTSEIRSIKSAEKSGSQSATSDPHTTHARSKRHHERRSLRHPFTRLSAKRRHSALTPSYGFRKLLRACYQ